MHPTSRAVTWIKALAVCALWVWVSANYLTEYGAVYDDGPYSRLPKSGKTPATDEKLSPQAALNTAAMLDLLAGAPTEALLDAPVPSDTGLHLTGL